MADSTRTHLLAQEVTDLQCTAAVLNDAVDGEMGIDVSHLVLEALRYTDNQVVDEGSDGSESGDVLAGAVVDLNADDILLGAGEVDSQVAQVLGKLASGTLDGDIPRLDVDLDCIGDRMVSKYVWKVESIMKIAFFHIPFHLSISPAYFRMCSHIPIYLEHR